MTAARNGRLQLRECSDTELVHTVLTGTHWLPAGSAEIRTGQQATRNFPTNQASPVKRLSTLLAKRLVRTPREQQSAEMMNTSSSVPSNSLVAVLSAGTGHLLSASAVPFVMPVHKTPLPAAEPCSFSSNNLLTAPSTAAATAATVAGPAAATATAAASSSAATAGVAVGHELSAGRLSGSSSMEMDIEEAEAVAATSSRKEAVAAADITPSQSVSDAQARVSTPKRGHNDNATAQVVASVTMHVAAQTPGSKDARAPLERGNLDPGSGSSGVSDKDGGRNQPPRVMQASDDVMETGAPISDSGAATDDIEMAVSDEPEMAVADEGETAVAEQQDVQEEEVGGSELSMSAFGTRNQGGSKPSGGDVAGSRTAGVGATSFEGLSSLIDRVPAIPRRIGKLFLF